MEIQIDITEIEQLIHSDKFAQFLLSNTTQFSTALFIVQTLDDKIQEIKDGTI